MTHNEASDEGRDRLFLSVAEALDHCQSLEMAMKRHIGGAFEYARKAINGVIVFKLDERDFEKRSLGQLIEVYEKLTDDGELVQELRQFVGERNFLAHKAIAQSYDAGGFFSPTDDFTERIKNIKTTALELYRKVYDASQIIMVHVWFDALTEEDSQATALGD